MKQHTDAMVSLVGLSRRQRQLAERHLGLVYLTVRRMTPTRSAERRELIQEGFLALADALRHHDPDRHGPFPPYAMARIRFAVGRYLHEGTSLIRVPYITQRRRKSRLAEAVQDRHRPEAPPRGVPVLPRVVAGSHASRRFFHDRPSHSESQPEDESSVTLGDLARACYARALRQAAMALARKYRDDPRRRLLLERCVRERWEIPETECRTQIRRLARELSLPLGTVTRCEAALSRLVSAALEADGFFAELRRLARHRPRGWRERVDSGEPASLQRRNSTSRIV